MIVDADVVAAAGENITVVIDGVGKMDSRAAGICRRHIELACMTDTQERSRQLHVQRLQLSAEPF